jgi:hypothetical protein
MVLALGFVAIVEFEIREHQFMWLMSRAEKTPLIQKPVPVEGTKELL